MKYEEWPVHKAIGGWLQHNHLWLLGLVWLVMQITCWQLYQGPHLFGDGISYLANARQLVNTGTFATGYGRLYMGYSLFLSLFLYLGLSLWAIGIAQVFLSGLATIAFYQTGLRLTQGDWCVTAFVTLGLICWLELQQFNAFILTESLFTSCLLFCLWAIVRIRTSLDVILAIALLLFTATIRPNGFIALAAAGLAGSWSLWQTGYRIWGVAGLLIWLFLAAWVLNQVVEPFYLIPSYAVGDVIFHYPPANVRPPTHLALPSATGWPLMRLGWFALHNIGYFGKLCVLKALYFLGWPRPWYSTLHRTWIVIILLPLYLGAVVGLSRQTSITPVQLYLVATILLQIGIVMLTTEDQNARFSAPLIPYWLQLAALGIQSLFSRQQVEKSTYAREVKLNEVVKNRPT